MDGILTPVSISYRNPRPREEDALIESLETPQPPLKAIQEPPSPPSSPEEALKILKAKPDFEALSLTLRYLLGKESNFDIRSPSPIAAQLIHVLVSDVVSNYWTILHEQQDLERLKKQKRKSSGRESELELVLSCLRSVTGLNAVLLRQKELIRLSKETRKVIEGPSISENLKILLQVLAELLKGDDTIEEIWKAISKTSNIPGKQKVLWQEALALIGSGKLLGLSAEAEDIINESSKGLGQKFWIADGVSYSNWLGRNITYWAKSIPSDSESELKACGDILGKAFRLGHTETILKEILTSLLLQPEDYSTQFSKLFDSLPGFEQRNALYAIFKLISKEYLSSIVTSVDDSRWWQSDASVVSAAAALITKVIANEETRKNQLIMWLTSSSGAGVGDGIAVRRAAIVVISRDKGDLETVLEKSLHQFGDQLYIRHTPILQQEAHAQVLLLAAGYVHRKSPLQLSMLMRSGIHLNAISNRLAASSPRARFLGMIVGEALSNLVDKEDKRMDFKMEELATPEAKWYKNLVIVQDTVGSLDPLKLGIVANVPKKRKEASKPRPPPPKPTVVRGTSKIVAIEEIENEDEEDESDEDELIPYAKPDSDAEDSDEDPTLITRNKPTAPVYIRDLISYFRDKENYDKQKLALATAPSLIRRKANFGTEVSSHAEELATLLVGLEDKYEIEDFADMRLQGMIAILISQPQKMGQWFSKTFFDGDYSLSQRASILTTLGLGARELGGFSTEESTSTSKQLPSSFSSKSLPSKTHALYATPSSETPELESLSTDLTRTMITPLATTLADKLSGPDILKVRTFSSRLSVEANRKRPTTNALAKVVSESFFFPLTGRFFMHLKAYGSSRSNVVFQPHLLSLFIKTLALLLHFSGPSTLSLPQMTSEFWDLLLGLRTQAIGDIIVVEAMLFAFLTMFEMNEDKRRLVQEHGRQLLETQEWVEGIFGRVGAGAGEEDQKVRMLAASVLVRIGESVEKYQALLMGDMASFRG